MAKPIDVSPEQFDEVVLQDTDLPVLVDFWSPTCGHCLALNPNYDAAADQLEGKIKFAKVAFPEGRDLFKQYGVRGTPTLVLFKDGKEVKREVGAKPTEAIVELCAEYC